MRPSTTPSVRATRSAMDPFSAKRRRINSTPDDEDPASQLQQIDRDRQPIESERRTLTQSVVGSLPRQAFENPAFQLQQIDHDHQRIIESERRLLTQSVVRNLSRQAVEDLLVEAALSHPSVMAQIVAANSSKQNHLELGSQKTETTTGTFAWEAPYRAQSGSHNGVNIGRASDWENGILSGPYRMADNDWENGGHSGIHNKVDGRKATDWENGVHSELNKGADATGETAKRTGRSLRKSTHLAKGKAKEENSGRFSPGFTGVEVRIQHAQMRVSFHLSGC